MYSFFFSFFFWTQKQIFPRADPQFSRNSKRLGNRLYTFHSFRSEELASKAHPMWFLWFLWSLLAEACKLDSRVYECTMRWIFDFFKRRACFILITRAVRIFHVFVVKTYFLCFSLQRGNRMVHSIIRLERLFTRAAASCTTLIRNRYDFNHNQNTLYEWNQVHNHLTSQFSHISLVILITQKCFRT